ncbi:MAG: response regulator [Bacteroidia bacterium]
MTKYRILILEDELEDVHQIKILMGKANILAEYYLADNEYSFRKGLNGFSPHIIFADYRLPTFSGLEALAIVQADPDPVPLIFVTGAIGEELAAETVLNGGAGLVLKNNLKALPQLFKRIMPESPDLLTRQSSSDRLLSTSLRLQQQISRNAGLLKKVQDFLSEMPDSDSMDRLKADLRDSVEWLEGLNESDNTNG